MSNRFLYPSESSKDTVGVHWLKPGLVGMLVVAFAIFVSPKPAGAVYYPNAGRINALSYCLNPNNWLDCAVAVQTAEDAMSDASVYNNNNGVPGDGTRGNAYQHGLWNSYMYYQFGFNIGKAQNMSDRIEVGNPNNQHTRMDYQNNWRGLIAAVDVHWELNYTTQGQFYLGAKWLNAGGANNAVLVDGDPSRWWYVSK